jgi:hypothetical protein
MIILLVLNYGFWPISTTFRSYLRPIVANIDLTEDIERNMIERDRLDANKKMSKLEVVLKRCQLPKVLWQQ